jgi:hypothetical protein
MFVKNVCFLLFRGEQFRTGLAGFEGDKGEIVQLHLEKITILLCIYAWQYQKTFRLHRQLGVRQVVNTV